MPAVPGRQRQRHIPFRPVYVKNAAAFVSGSVFYPSIVNFHPPQIPKIVS